MWQLEIVEVGLKIFCIASVIALTALPSAGQVLILSEDFQGAIPPAGWTRSQNSPSVGWEYGSDLGSQYFVIPAHTTYAASNDDAHDDSTGTLNLADRDRLISPVLDLTPYSATGVVLDFEYFLPGTYGSDGSVEVSTNGGATWVEIAALDSTSQWNSASIDLSAYTVSSSVIFAFRHNDNGQWSDGFAVDDVTVRSVSSLDVSVDEVTVDPYLPTGSTPITVLITNQGATAVSSVAVVYQVDSGTAIPGVISGLNLGLGQSAEVAHPTPYHFGSAGQSIIEFTVVAVNGAADGNPSNNTATGSVEVLTNVPTKHTVLEVHTGSWCQFCPDGTVRMEEVAATVPNAIVVTVHYNDDMAIPDGETVSSAYIGGYPGGTVDRFKFDDQSDVEVNRGIWLSKATERAASVVPVEVSIPMIAYDQATRTLEVEVQAEFLASVDGDLRLNCWVVEDTVVGSGSGFDQMNFYNTQAGHPFFGAGNPIIGFEHDRVVRSMLGGPWGTSGVIPGVVAAGESYSTTYSYVIPVDQDLQRMTVVGIVGFYATDTHQRHILNAVQVVADPMIFQDGFENGDTLAWTATTP